MRERLGSSSQEHSEAVFVSLKELVFLSEPKARERHIGSTSEIVLWLAGVMEKEEFWQKLNQSLAEDRQKRQTLRQFFLDEQNNGTLGRYTWTQAFLSLDNFLKKFDTRAIEFIFRDFQPQNRDPRLIHFISATRRLAADKYPRLTRSDFEDYLWLLENQLFWETLEADLTRLKKPMSIRAFFALPYKKRWREFRDIQTALSETSTRHGWDDQRDEPLKTDYSNFNRFVRKNFGQDPKTFLLQYAPSLDDSALKETVTRTKDLLRTKLLPLKKSVEIKVITNQESSEIINSQTFWENFTKDIENHASSPKQAFSLSSFLRYYERETNNICYTRPGSHAYLITRYVESIKGFMRRNSLPAKRLVHELMWKFKPEVNLAQLTIRAKTLCAEMFPLDCLFVALQTPEFWEGFEKDAISVVGPHSLLSFLRYFSHDNPSCNEGKYLPGTSKYQRLAHQAYSKKREFIEFVSCLGIENVKNCKDGLVELFWQTSPETLKPLLLEKFPKDFDPERQLKRKKEVKLRARAKEAATKLAILPESPIQLRLSSTKDIETFRRKFWFQAHQRQISVRTEFLGKCVTLYVQRVKEKSRYQP